MNNILNPVNAYTIRTSRKAGNIELLGRKWKNLFCMSTLLLCMLYSPSLLCAEDEIFFGDIQVSTPSYPAGSLEHHFGIYEFSVGWQGIGAAKAWVSLRPKGDAIEVRTLSRTNSFIDIFYKMRFESFSSVNGKTFRPRETRMRHQENSKIKNIQMKFVSPRKVTSRQDRNERKREQFEFDPKNDMLDPFAAMLLARSLEWKKGQSRNFDIFTGKSRYLVNLKIVDEKVIEALGEKRDCWIVSPRVKKLNEKNPQKKLRSARIYVSKDATREILLLESEVFIGTVKAKLESFEPFSPEQEEKLVKEQGEAIS